MDTSQGDVSFSTEITVDNELEGTAEANVELEDINLKKEEHAWPYPMTEDALVLAHKALRLDVGDFSRVLEALRKQLGRDAKLLPWETKRINLWWERFRSTFRDYIEKEDRLLIPCVEKKVKLPGKVTADHVTLLTTLDQCSASVAKLIKSASVAESLSILEKLEVSWAALTRLALANFEDEETTLLPLMRQNFSYEEMCPVLLQMYPQHSVKSHTTPPASPSDPVKDATQKEQDLLALAHLLRPMTAAQRKEWLREEKFGFWARSVVIPRTCKKYNTTITAKLEQIVTGKYVNRKQQLFSCGAPPNVKE